MTSHFSGNYDDLIKRLQTDAAVIAPFGSRSGTERWECAQAMIEAVTAIKSLRKEIDEPCTAPPSMALPCPTIPAFCEPCLNPLSENKP